MKPAIFNTEMVRAILDGRKTQTRRAIKKYTYEPNHRVVRRMIETGNLKQPYKVGDIIYVRETFIHGVKHDENDRPLTTEDGSDWIWETYYRADDEYLNWVDTDGDEINPPWKPSIHMPKEYARLFLRVKDVRIERLNEISEEDAKAEGVEEIFFYEEPFYRDYRYYLKKLKVATVFPNAKKSFETLWESIYGKDSFDNRYVWVIEFEQISKEEAMSETAT